MTDGEPIRGLLNDAVDGLSAVAAHGRTDADRSLRAAEVGGTPGSVFDALANAWTAPEGLRDEGIRPRGSLGLAAPYTPATARPPVHVAQRPSRPRWRPGRTRPMAPE